MRVLTENEVRELALRSAAGMQFVVPPGALLTPLARDYLRERGLEIVEQRGPGAGSRPQGGGGAGGGAGEEALVEAVAAEVARSLAGGARPAGGAASAAGPQALLAGLPRSASVNQDQRAVVWAIGGDRPGILAAVADLLGERKVNILEISQTILSGIFAMVVIVDLSQCACPFGDLKQALEETGRKLGINLSAQRDEIFQYMHRI